MDDLVGETGAVLSPAVSGARFDATGGWESAVFLDAGLIAGAVLLFCPAREHARSSVLGDRSARPPAGGRLARGELRAGSGAAP
jgi:hypothetical protein